MWGGHNSINSISHGSRGQDLWKGPLMVWGLWSGCRQMAGTGVWLAQGQLVGLPFQVVSSPLVWSLPLSESELPHSMATKSFKSQWPIKQQRSRPAFYEPALEVT